MVFVPKMYFQLIMPAIIIIIIIIIHYLILIAGRDYLPYFMGERNRFRDLSLSQAIALVLLPSYWPVREETVVLESRPIQRCFK